MSGFNISDRQIALFLMAVATLWALAEGAPIWLVAALVLPPLLHAVLLHYAGYLKTRLSRILGRKRCRT